ncbi:hypothetical protein L596_001189 [Steinernema carpocapsae]|uniref:Catalase core domain-containing protein n=1 Tax=Steinernema carpocapsae TaxID=34508 RepID=A0A4U8UL30_STECR|nr:hypothetical protein L596_001189 [Steinernema carpocapsae]
MSCPKSGKSCPHAEQLANQKQSTPRPHTMTTSNGAPIHEKNHVLTAGPRGPLLMQDVVFMDEMAHFDRERIHSVLSTPRAVELMATLRSPTTLPSTARLICSTRSANALPCSFDSPPSVVNPEVPSDPRGFAMKFFTEEGNWDLVGNNTPIFFIREPILFPPATHLKDPNMVWDFFSLRPESTHQVMFLFGDRGTPDGFRHMNGYGSHTFKLVNKNGEAVYCKFHAKTAQKIKNLPAEEAARLEGTDPDYSIRDLYDAIESGDYPQWNFFVQVMTFAQAEKCRFNPFDVTKVWSHSEYPLIPVGKFVLNRNPVNYFAEVEQSAFAPSHVVPGIEFSPDKMLQGRLFSYTDTHFHRLGTNYIHLPINCPYRSRPHNTQRDGAANFGDNQGGAPNYHPNSFNGPPAVMSRNTCSTFPMTLTASTTLMTTTSASLAIWNKVLDKDARKRLVQNIAGSLGKCKPFIQERAIKNFAQVHEDFGCMLREEIQMMNKCADHRHHL